MLYWCCFFDGRSSSKYYQHNLYNCNHIFIGCDNMNRSILLCCWCFLWFASIKLTVSVHFLRCDAHIIWVQCARIIPSARNNSVFLQLDTSISACSSTRNIQLKLKTMSTLKKAFDINRHIILHTHYLMILRFQRKA